MQAWVCQIYKLIVEICFSKSCSNLCLFFLLNFFVQSFDLSGSILIAFCHLCWSIFVWSSFFFKSRMRIVFHLPPLRLSIFFLLWVMICTFVFYTLPIPVEFQQKLFVLVFPWVSCGLTMAHLNTKILSKKVIFAFWKISIYSARPVNFSLDVSWGLSNIQVNSRNLLLKELFNFVFIFHPEFFLFNHLTPLEVFWLYFVICTVPSSFGPLFF